MNLNTLLKSIPNGTLCNFYRDNISILSLRLTRKLIGKRRKILSSIAVTEDALFIEKAHISLYDNLKQVTFDKDSINIYL